MNGFFLALLLLTLLAFLNMEYGDCVLVGACRVF